MDKNTKTYFTYLLLCGDGTLYAGITTDLCRRFYEHAGGKRGARYTRLRGAVRFAAAWESDGRAEASRLEARLKQLSRKEKERLVAEADAPLPAEGNYRRVPDDILTGASSPICKGSL